MRNFKPPDKLPEDATVDEIANYSRHINLEQFRKSLQHYAEVDSNLLLTIRRLLNRAATL